MEDFWSTYNYMVRPNDLPNTTDYHLFRSGIKPTWEDSNNSRGGKFILRLRKGLASNYFENLIFAIIGETLAPGHEEDVCGVVMSVRLSEDILSVWNRESNNRDARDKIGEGIRKVLQLPGFATMVSFLFFYFICWGGDFAHLEHPSMPFETPIHAREKRGDIVGLCLLGTL